jgi:DNA-directed RNA polymerase sigma subunit (sigma70/sigma32)
MKEVKQFVTRNYQALDKDEVERHANNVKLAMVRLTELSYPNRFEKADPSILKTDMIVKKGLKSRDALFLANLPLVLLKVPRYYRGNDLEKACQDGFIALLRACDLYDPGTGYAFSTYAANWIIQSTKQCNAREITGMKVNIALIYLKNNCKKFVQSFQAQHDRYPTISEIALELDKTETEIRDALSIPIEVSADESSSSQADAHTKLDLIASEMREDDDQDFFDTLNFNKQKGNPILLMAISGVVDKLKRKENLSERELQQVEDALKVIAT